MSAPEKPSSRFHLARRGVGVGLTSLRDYGIVVSFVAIFVYLTFKSPVFLTKVNLFNVLDGNSSDGIMACGGTLVLIAGGFDLSVGAIFALSGVIAALLAPHMAADLAILIGALSGLGVGICNGFITTVGRINPLVGTLSTSIIIQGVALVLTSGLLVNVTAHGFTSLGQGTIFTLHYSVIVWAVVALICGFLLWLTKYGRYIYATGGNAEAARLSGVRVNLVRGSTYAISGLSAGIAGVIVTSRVATGDASTGGVPARGHRGNRHRRHFDPGRTGRDLAQRPRHPAARVDRQRLQPAGREPDLPADPRGNDHPDGRRGGRLGPEDEHVSTRSVLTIRTKPGRRDELVELFTRLQILEKASRQEGFISSEVHVPVDGDDHVLVTATWTSPDAYRGWLESPVREEMRPELEQLADGEPESRVYEIVETFTR